MASLVAISNGQVNSLSGLPACRDRTTNAPMPEVIAHSVEFVAWPEKAGELRTVLPEVLRMALGSIEDFSAYMVLVSEQEARLVTVVTLWAGTNRAKQCEQNSKRLKRLLTPFVERWLRTRSLAAFMSIR